MGRPTKKPPPSGPNRRGFLKTSSTAAAVLASTVAAPLSAEAHRREDAGRFQHGVASGDPLSDRVILWTRVTPARAEGHDHPTDVRVELALDPELRRVVRRGTIRTGASRDHTVKVDVTGLRPATTYYYRFESGGERSPIGRTRTLPVGTVERLRFAVLSCASLGHGVFNAYRRVAERAELDAVIHLGDYLYEYASMQYGTARALEPVHETLTLTDYRLRHAQYKRDPDLQAVHRQHPMICMWDDHDVANDAWRDGAGNHTEGVEGPWTDRVAAALRAYFEWMPVRVPDPARPRQLQRTFRMGDLVDLTLLEERLVARSQQVPAPLATPFGPGFTQTGEFANPERTMLGAEQEAQLAASLRASPARWKLLGQGVMFAQLKLQGAPRSAGGGLFTNTDQWDGYEPARDRFFKVLQGDAEHPPVKNVVMLTGDIHSAWAADLTPDPNNPDLASGGYHGVTGAGSHAVEFITPSVTSPATVPDPDGRLSIGLRAINPHLKFIDLNQRGYLLVDVTPQRVVGEWWFVDTVASASRIQTLGAAFAVDHGSQRLQPAAPTSVPTTGVPPLAPGVD